MPPAARRVRTECLDHVNRSILRSAPLGLPAASLLALILGNAVPYERRVVMVVLVVAANLVGVCGALAYRVRRRTQLIIERWPMVQVYGFALGAAWGSVALVAFPGDDRVDLRCVIALFA